MPYPYRKKPKPPSRTKQVAVGLSGASVLTVVAVGAAGLPGMLALPLGWAGAAYATRNPRMTPAIKPSTTARIVGVVGVGIGAGLDALGILPGTAEIGFAAGAILPFLNDELGRRLSGRRNTTAKLADVKIVERRPPRRPR